MRVGSAFLFVQLALAGLSLARAESSPPRSGPWGARCQAAVERTRVAVGRRWPAFARAGLKTLRTPDGGVTLEVGGQPRQARFEVTVVEDSTALDADWRSEAAPDGSHERLARNRRGLRAVLSSEAASAAERQKFAAAFRPVLDSCLVLGARWVRGDGDVCLPVVVSKCGCVHDECVIGRRITDRAQTEQGPRYSVRHPFWEGVTLAAKVTRACTYGTECGVALDALDVDCERRCAPRLDSFPACHFERGACVSGR